MTAFETKRHIEIDERYQGINLTEFVFSFDKQIENDQIVDIFIRSKHFTYDCLRDCIKVDPDGGYLGQAFNIENVKISDFKKSKKEGVIKFLIDFINEPNWGDDRNDFAKILDKFFEIFKTLNESVFYIISKDWFDKDDEKFIGPGSWVYTYYFLIISVDRNANLLTLSEWTYD